MRFIPQPIKAKFLKRLNRFEAIIELEDEHHLCHVPNTGRLKELLTEGAEVYVQHFDSPTRKTKYKLLLVKKGDRLISIDSAGVPNKVIYDALKSRNLEEFKHFDNVIREVVFGDSRFDFYLESKEEKCFIEVKGVTLIKGNYSSFPDAPTLRGSKHMEELIKAKREGYKAAVVFVIQTSNVDYITPNDEIDKLFGKRIREAFNIGVEVYAYECKISLDGIEISNRIDVKL